MAKRIGAPHTCALAKDPAMADFHKTMDKLAYSRSLWEVFIDFLTLTICGMLSDQTPDHPRERQYMETMKRYDADAPKLFSRLLGLTFNYMTRTNRECLSELWEVYAANAGLGQFFTPWHVCEFMARVTMGNVDWSQYSQENKCWIGDCACGGGRTLLAAAKQIPLTEINSAAFHGIDVDPNVCMIAALNLLFFNLNGVIVNGDGLSLQGTRVYLVKHTFAGARMVESTDPETVRFWIEKGLRRVESKPEPKSEPPKPAPVPEPSRPAMIEAPEGAQMTFNF